MGDRGLTRLGRRFAGVLRRRWRRMAVVMLPLLLALLHATGALRIPVLERLDQWIYDARLRATMPRTLDERIVIIDLDEQSLERVGHWPWGRDTMARLTQELIERQQVAVVGFDIVFAEPDGSSGLKSLQQLAQGPLRGQPGFVDQLARLAPELDFDARFARVLEGQNVVLGYYFTSDRDGKARGSLPAPALDAALLQGRQLRATTWNGYGSNIALLAQAAPVAGFFNAMNDADGVVRSLPLLAEYQGQYYESLALAVFRTLLGKPQVHPVYAHTDATGGAQALQAIELHQDGRTLQLPVDDQLATLVPYRGPGGPRGGSFRYIPPSMSSTGGWHLPACKGRSFWWGPRRPACKTFAPHQWTVHTPGWRHTPMSSRVFWMVRVRCGRTMPPGSMCSRSCVRGCCWHWRCRCSAPARRWG